MLHGACSLARTAADRPHNRGIMRWENGISYEGEWQVRYGRCSDRCYHCSG